jgi:hypothetical protein
MQLLEMIGWRITCAHILAKCPTNAKFPVAILPLPRRVNYGDTYKLILGENPLNVKLLDVTMQLLQREI